MHIAYNGDYVSEKMKIKSNTKKIKHNDHKNKISRINNVV